MSKTSDSKKAVLARRQFLVGAAAGAAAAGAAVVAGKPSEVVQASPSEQPDSKGKGYRMTEHVKTYYKTLMV